MKLVFLNTWHSKLHEPLRDYVRVAREDTDVFCFQEAEAETQSAYDDLLAGYNRYHHDKAQRNLFLANVIFVRKGITVTESGALLREGADIGFANFVTLSNGNCETSVCNVHGIPHPANKLDNPERSHSLKLLLITLKVVNVSSSAAILICYRKPRAFGCSKSMVIKI